MRTIFMAQGFIKVEFADAAGKHNANRGKEHHYPPVRCTVFQNGAPDMKFECLLRENNSL